MCTQSWVIHEADPCFIRGRRLQVSPMKTTPYWSFLFYVTNTHNKGPFVSHAALAILITHEIDRNWELIQFCMQLINLLCVLPWQLLLPHCYNGGMYLCNCCLHVLPPSCKFVWLNESYFYKWLIVLPSELLTNFLPNNIL